MQINFIGGALRIHTFDLNELKSCVVWPLFELGEEKNVCLKYINRFKLLRQDILFLQSFLKAKEDEQLEEYLRDLDSQVMVCSQSICELAELKEKRVVCQKHHRIIIENHNCFHSALTDFNKLLWTIALHFAI